VTSLVKNGPRIRPKVLDRKKKSKMRVYRHGQRTTDDQKNSLGAFSLGEQKAECNCQKIKPKKSNQFYFALQNSIP
jgi:hypothetical protein